MERKINKLIYFQKYMNHFKKFKNKKKVHILNRNGEYQILICPNCFEEKFIFDNDKNEYFCSNCNFSMNKKEFQIFAKIEYHKGILFDFNHGEKKLHKVFDHHGIFSQDIMQTATSIVIEFIEDVSELNPNFRGIMLIKKIREQLERYTNQGFALYVDHLDIDSLLAVFAFRNPNFAMEYKDILVKLSLYQDLTLLDDRAELYYLIIWSMILILKDEGRNDDYIFNYMLKELKNIFINPQDYKKYAIIENEKIQKDYQLLLDIKFDDYFYVDKKLSSKILHFKNPNGFSRLPSLFKFTKNYKNGKYNLPFLIKYNVKGFFCSFSVNPNVKGFEEYNLTNLESIIYSLERKKIEEKINNRDKKKELENRFRILMQEIDDKNKNNNLYNLRIFIQSDEYDMFDSILDELLKNNQTNINLIDLKKLFNSLLSIKQKILDNIEVKTNNLDNKIINDIKNNNFASAEKSFKNNKKRIDNVNFEKYNDFFRNFKNMKIQIIKLITRIIDNETKNLSEELNKVKQELERIGDNNVVENYKDLWVIKSCLILLRGQTNLSNEEIQILIANNLHLIKK